MRLSRLLIHALPGLVYNIFMEVKNEGKSKSH